MNNDQQVTQSQSDKTANHIKEMASIAQAASINAGQANVTGFIERQSQAFEENVEAVANVLEILMDGELPYHLAVLRATERIEQRYLGKQNEPIQKWELPKLEIKIPKIPTFNSFYQDAEIIQNQLQQTIQEPT